MLRQAIEPDLNFAKNWPEEEKDTDDWIRVHVEDYARVIEERKHLRQQVTELQELCTKQCLEIRELRGRLRT
jgi:hypothetical protein